MRILVPDEHQLQAETTAVLNGHHKDVDMTPWERIAQANQMALEAAKDPYIRQAAVSALKNCQNVPARGGQVLAKWLRKNVTYAAEAPGVEVLQGPFTTLALRLGDCDDLAITWASLARSVGIDAYVAGVAEKSVPDALLHAVGYDHNLNAHWELSLDRRWGGNWVQPLAFKLPASYLSVWWSPEEHRKGYWVDDGQGYRAVDSAPEPTKGTQTMLIRYGNPKAPPAATGVYADKTGTAPAGSDPGGGTSIRDSWRETGQDTVGTVVSWLFGGDSPIDDDVSTPPALPDPLLDPFSTQAAPGVPSWIWGLLGLGAVGGLVVYMVKK